MLHHPPTPAMLLLLSHFSRVWLCATPSLGFSGQEHWSELPFPSPMHKSEKWKWSRSVMSNLRDPMDCSRPGSSDHGIFQARVLEWVPLPSPTPALTTPNEAIPAVACCAPSAWDATPTWPSPIITESTMQTLLLFYHVLHPKWRQTYLFPISQVLHHFGGFPGVASGKEPACQWGRHKRWGFNPRAGKISPGGGHGNPL